MTPFNSPSTAQLLSEDGSAVTSSSSNPNMIIDGNQNNFMQEVLDGSKTIPVLVDFWADWCSPCKQLTPVLEKVVIAAKGRVKLVKLNVDENQALTQQLMQVGLPMQSIPVVAAFWQGQIVDLFQGVQPESAIQKFIDQVLKAAGSAMPSEDFIEQGKEFLENHQYEEAMGAYSQALELEPEKPEAWGGMIRALLAHSGPEAAQEVIEQVPESLLENGEITGAKAAIDLAIEGQKAQSEFQSFLDKVTANPDDHQARYDLASAYNAAGKRKEAADELLEIVKKDRSWNDEAAKKQLLRLFEAWGLDDPSTLEARRHLSSLLFS
ncbi:Chaperedoxin CnoX [Commensalibacter communis]|uniref:thioredoxin family protein n=1 Tax=Commensalibacter communis TaxID=2972786 RepID=UPI0022FFC3A1|nr:co-chaperone YbbN [Commensalibacter communis]CAI3929614.1 Chaperedoxin CnoX [Commensalibacter communis]CAI3929671.1 Chaperedoxin CnoX [Commensalibacter communis]